MDATPEQLLGVYGEDAYEIVAMREFLRRVKEAEGDRDERRALAEVEGRRWTEDDEKLRVGDNFFEWAAGELDGRSLCEREGMIRSGPSGEGPDLTKGEG